jgi:hypothetical protein
MSAGNGSWIACTAGCGAGRRRQLFGKSTVPMMGSIDSQETLGRASCAAAMCPYVQLSTRARSGRRPVATVRNVPIAVVRFAARMVDEGYRRARDLDVLNPAQEPICSRRATYPTTAPLSKAVVRSIQPIRSSGISAERLHPTALTRRFRPFSDIRAHRLVAPERSFGSARRPQQDDPPRWVCTGMLHSGRLRRGAYRGCTEVAISRIHRASHRPVAPSGASWRPTSLSAPSTGANRPALRRLVQEHAVWFHSRTNANTCAERPPAHQGQGERHSPARHPGTRVAEYALRQTRQ